MAKIEVKNVEIGTLLEQAVFGEPPKVLAYRCEVEVEIWGADSYAEALAEVERRLTA